MHCLLATCLPTLVHKHAPGIIPPLWYLPFNIVLKRRKPDWEEEFANETSMYEILKPLQGSTIPICYGQVKCDDGTPALVLSDVGGQALGEDEVLEADEAELRGIITKALNDMISMGFQHEDVKLDNFRLVGDRVVILDLERVMSLRHTPEKACMVALEDLIESWAYYRDNKRKNAKYR